MGACEYDNTEFGKNARDAYERLVSDALHERGHDYYSGTIATSSGYNKLTVPNGWSTEEVNEVLWYLRDYGDLREPLPVRRKFSADWERTRYLRERKLSVKFCKLDPSTRELFRHRANGFVKGEAAVCMELPAKEQRVWRERSPHLKGKQGRFFRFVGLAPC